MNRSFKGDILQPRIVTLGLRWTLVHTRTCSSIDLLISMYSSTALAGTEMSKTELQEQTMNTKMHAPKHMRERERELKQKGHHQHHHLILTLSIWVS